MWINSFLAVCVMLFSGNYLHGFVQQDSSKYEFGVSLSMSYILNRSVEDNERFKSSYRNPFKAAISVSRLFNDRKTSVGIGFGLQSHQASYELSITGNLLGLPNDLVSQNDYSFSELSILCRVSRQVFEIRQKVKVDILVEGAFARHSILVKNRTYLSPTLNEVATLKFNNGGLDSYVLCQVGLFVRVLERKCLKVSPFVSYTFDVTPGRQLGGEFSENNGGSTTTLVFEYPFNYLNTGVYLFF